MVLVHSLVIFFGGAEVDANHPSREVGVACGRDGGNLPAMLQAISKYGSSMMSTSFLARPHWILFFSVPW